MNRKLEVLLDNGHGKETPGKRSPRWKDTSQIFEWEYTRRLTKEIKRRLDCLGFKVIMVTPEEWDVPLSERTKRIRNIENENTYVVSVHLNAFDYSSTANGWEAHTYLGTSLSDKYSKIFYDNAEEILKGRNIRKGGPSHDPDYDSNFAMLRNVKSPAILTENLFMTNYEDCKFLNSEKGFNSIVDIHVNSIVKINNIKINDND